jgi:large subunit ribosomal protein LX
VGFGLPALSTSISVAFTRRHPIPVCIDEWSVRIPECSHTLASGDEFEPIGNLVPRTCLEDFQDEEAFVVRGRYRARDVWQEFENTVRAPNDDVAAERIYAEIGSRHARKRTEVEIREVSVR